MLFAGVDGGRAQYGCFSFFGEHNCEQIEAASSKIPVAMPSSTSVLTPEKLTHICNLNKDCLEVYLDYLSLKDLATLAQTCKHFQQATGEFYENQFAARARCKNGNIFSQTSMMNININRFSTFVRSIVIGNEDIGIFQL